MAPHLVFGAGGIGTTLQSFTFTWDTPEKVSELLSLLQRLSILELDSAASYPPTNAWNTETLLGQAGAIEKGFIIDSKIASHTGSQQLNDGGISSSTARTLELLQTRKVRTMYAHAPDKSTPLEETALAFHKQFEAGNFEYLGLCNYSVAELSRYFEICEEKDYVKPAIYQGFYNALYREPEEELIPLLRKHNCKYFVYSPLAGGFLTGKVTFALDSGDMSTLERTRWRGESKFPFYGYLFAKPSMHAAIRLLKSSCDAALPALTLQEVSMRWLMYHSALQDGDAIIFGAKSLEQLESNVTEARKGPLSGAPLETVERLWGFVKEQEKNTV